MATSRTTEVTEEFGSGMVRPGMTLTTAMLSPVVGGLVRTWTDTGTRLWSVELQAELASVVGRGFTGRTPMPDERFRDVGLLHEESGALVVQYRHDADLEYIGFASAKYFQLGEPRGLPDDPGEELAEFLVGAVQWATWRGEFFVAELGGWDAPEKPYCLFAVVDQGDGPVSMVEASPAPSNSPIWPEAREGEPGATVTAPATVDATRRSLVHRRSDTRMGRGAMGCRPDLRRSPGWPAVHSEMAVPGVSGIDVARCRLPCPRR